MMSSASRRARMRPVAACGTPSRWAISCATTAPTRSSCESVASSGWERVACRRARRNATPATQGTETITVPSAVRLPRLALPQWSPPLRRGCDDRITTTSAPGPSSGWQASSQTCQTVATPAESSRPVATFRARSSIVQSTRESACARTRSRGRSSSGAAPGVNPDDISTISSVTMSPPASRSRGRVVRREAQTVDGRCHGFCPRMDLHSIHPGTDASWPGSERPT